MRSIVQCGKTVANVIRAKPSFDAHSSNGREDAKNGEIVHDVMLDVGCLFVVGTFDADVVCKSCVFQNSDETLDRNLDGLTDLVLSFESDNNNKQ